MIQIPLSLSGPADQFAAAVETYRAALEKHRKGKPGIPSPMSSPLIDQLIQCVPDTGPVAKRGPDKFVVLPYTIVDDTPRTEEASKTIQVLRETINQGA